MRKWSSHLATGKDRPFSVFRLPNYPVAPAKNHFHTSTPHPQDAVQDSIVQHKPAPLRNRAQRLRASTQEVENLYYQHAGVNNTTAGHSDTNRQSAPSNGDRFEHSTSQRNPKLGVPLSKPVLEGEVPPSAKQTIPPLSRSVRGGHGGAIDARNFAASPDQKTDDGRFTMGRTGAVDTRSFGARAKHQRNDGQVRATPADGRHLAARSSQQPDNGHSTLGRRDGLDARKLSARPMQQSNNGDIATGERDSTEPKNLGAKPPEFSMGLRTGRFRSQLGTSRSDAKNTSEAFDRRSDGGASSSQLTSRGGRLRQPQSGRNNSGREPRRRDKDRQAILTGDSDRKAVPVWNEEEEEYIKQKREKEAGQSLIFEPAKVTPASLSGVHPAVVSGLRGMGEVLSERLVLAKQHLQGQDVIWHSKEQKVDVMTLVRKLQGVNGEATVEQKNEKALSSTVEVEQQTQSLLQKLLEGQYRFSKPQQGKDVLGHVARHTDRNESYFPDDQRSLLAKVKTLIPQNSGRARGQGPESEAKP